LEGDEVQPLILAAEENAGDVLVVELGGGAGFLVKAADVLLVGGHFRRQNLQGDAAVQLQVVGADHRRHAADADRLDQLEMGEPPAAEGAAENLFRGHLARRGPGDHRGGVVGQIGGGGDEQGGGRAFLGGGGGGVRAGGGGGGGGMGASRRDRARRGSGIG